MDFSKLPAILTPDLGLLFWMLLAFAVVFFVLAKYGFPAIVGMVEERNRYIEDSLKKAHEAQERLANIEKEGESILQEARAKQAQILKEAAETRLYCGTGSGEGESRRCPTLGRCPRGYRTGEESRYRRHPSAGCRT